MRRTLCSRRLLILSLLVCPALISSGCSCSDGVNRRMARPRRVVDDEEPVAKAAPPAPASTAQGQPAGGTQPTATQPGPKTQAPGVPAPGTPQELPQGGAEKVNVAAIDPESTPNVQTRRGFAIVRMRKIGLAIGDYVRQKNQYPAPATYKDGYPQLSWRVNLLPYLGHAELYQEFHLNEPWNSEHNKKLLAKIPPVFQSPERRDDKTNYHLVTGPGTMFSGQAGPKPGDIADGLGNTAMLVEVDDAKAVPWTQPIDFVASPDGDPRAGLDGLRDDGFFVVFANASLYRISPDVGAPSVRSVFTKSGQETVAASSFCQPAVPDIDPDYVGRIKHAPPTRPIVAIGTNPGGSEGPTPHSTPSGVGTAPSGVGTAPSGVGTGPAKPVGVADAKTKLPVPDADAQEKSEALFREIFREEFESAKTPKQKYEFAKRLFDHVKKVKDDPSGRYVMLKKGSMFATDVGELTAALSIDDQLIAAFQVDAHQVKVDTVLRADAYRGPMSKADNDKLILVSEELVTKAMFNDDYAQAQKLIDVAMEAAKRGKERYKTDDLVKRKKEVAHARNEYRKVEKVVDALKDDPEDPDSNLIVGKYLCFVKHNWDRGLPMLAIGSDDGLKRLAREELKQPPEAEGQAQLADQWFDLAERDKDKDAATRKEMRLRAVHWYLVAMNRLPAGLLQVKADVRIKAAEKEYGKEAVESLRVASKVGPNPRANPDP